MQNPLDLTDEDIAALVHDISAEGGPATYGAIVSVDAVVRFVIDWLRGNAEGGDGEEDVNPCERR
jgi:hypothetical protein